MKDSVETLDEYLEDMQHDMRMYQEMGAHLDRLGELENVLEEESATIQDGMLSGKPEGMRRAFSRFRYVINRIQGFANDSGTESDSRLASSLQVLLRRLNADETRFMQRLERWNWWTEFSCRLVMWSYLARFWWAGKRHQWNSRRLAEQC